MFPLVSALCAVLSLPAFDYGFLAWFCLIPFLYHCRKPVSSPGLSSVSCLDTFMAMVPSPGCRPPKASAMRNLFFLLSQLQPLLCGLWISVQPDQAGYGFLDHCRRPRVVGGIGICTGKLFFPFTALELHCAFPVSISDPDSNFRYYRHVWRLFYGCFGESVSEPAADIFFQGKRGWAARYFKYRLFEKLDPLRHFDNYSYYLYHFLWLAADQHTGSDGHIRVAIVQANVMAKNNMAPAEQREHLSAYRQLSLEAAKKLPDLIIWPASSLPADFRSREFAEQFKK